MHLNCLKIIYAKITSLSVIFWENAISSILHFFPERSYFIICSISRAPTQPRQCKLRYLIQLNVWSDHHSKWISHQINKKMLARFFEIFQKTWFHHFFHFFYEIIIFPDFFNIWSSYVGKSKWKQYCNIAVLLLKQSEAFSAKIAAMKTAVIFWMSFCDHLSYL